MERELENFIVTSDKELQYFDDVVNHITENEKRILKFFKLEKLPQKVEIQILSYEPFKEFIITNRHKMPDFVCGNSDFDNKVIRLLNIEDRIKYTIHKNTSVDSFEKTVLHEIAHQCHSVHNNDSFQTKWFREGLASNLANQRYKPQDINKCDFVKLKEEFDNYESYYSYPYSCAIVNYVLLNYPEEEIEKLYSNSDYLRERTDSIFEEAKTWINNKSRNVDSEKDR